MDDENEGVTPTAEGNPPSDEAKALREELAAAKRERAEADAARKLSESRYENDMRQVQSWASSLAAAQAAPREEVQDPNSVATVADIEKRLSAQREAMIGDFAKTTVGTLQVQKEMNENRLFENKERYPFADKYAGEIKQLADQAFRADPLSMAKPDSYDKIYKLVSGLHADEVFEHRFNERISRMREEGEIDPGYPSGASSEPPRRPAIPRSDGGQPRPAQRNARSVRLSEDEEFTVKRYFNGDVKRFHEAREASEAEESTGTKNSLGRDPFGAKGRERF